MEGYDFQKILIYLLAAGIGIFYFQHIMKNKSLLSTLNLKLRCRLITFLTSKLNFTQWKSNMYPSISRLWTLSMKNTLQLTRKLSMPSTTRRFMRKYMRRFMQLRTLSIQRLMSLNMWQILNPYLK